MKKKTIEITKTQLVVWIVGNIGLIVYGIWWISSLSTKVDYLNKQVENFYQFIMKGY